ncbi:hypothetical protein ELB75_09810 [Eikenella corrodens]|uniref:Uncharacterized protein n=1 Tax=Eikenella corrodens TaxID=539 RepID=A0A3S9SLH4_EIKCO|nr:hypothetical protein ELB75_09810 [Eikenella corrodens]
MAIACFRIFYPKGGIFRFGNPRKVLNLTAVSDLNLLPLGQKSAWKSSCQQPQSGYLKNHLQVA